MSNGDRGLYLALSAAQERRGICHPWRADLHEFRVANELTPPYVGLVPGFHCTGSVGRPAVGRQAYHYHIFGVPGIIHSHVCQWLLGWLRGQLNGSTWAQSDI